MKIWCSFLFVFALVCSAFADSPPPPPQPSPEARVAEINKLVAGLRPQKGEIDLKGGLAKIKVPEQFLYLNSSDAETVLTKIWGNPEGSGTLGLLVPVGFSPLADDGWAVVITYDEDGYVKDDDAVSLNYDKLLADMKERTHEANKTREKQGYSSVELIGWATPPRYDAATHKMYWAKELKFSRSPEHTLNYNVRLLGRRGVLVLNAVAAMDQLKTVQAATPAILDAVNFQTGHRYVDFDGSKDKVAAYGIAALVAGGIAAKAGFFKLLWIGILAAKKFIVLGIVALSGFIKKVFAGRKAKSPFVAPETPPASPQNPEQR
jgi:uncharacterized membrane-anchored protein